MTTNYPPIYKKSSNPYPLPPTLLVVLIFCAWKVICRLVVQVVVEGGDGDDDQDGSPGRMLLLPANGSSALQGPFIQISEGPSFVASRALADNRRHECVYCGKKFPTPSKLNRHELVQLANKFVG
jgi:hypothetical protein